ncbi:MAG: amino acid adenylation domain-containing protein [Clostridia bacterium]|nr:amino acid adenylation domain-containing protein [Clostridia bacterium]
MSKNMYSLTNPQKSIWQTGEFYKGTSIENISGRATILEKVDFKNFEKAINLFIEKNDSFRLKFVIDNTEVKQYVEDYKYFSFEKIRVTSEKDVKKIEDEFSNYVFDVLNSYLFKFVLYEFPDGHGGFVIVMHHLISDAWTSGLVISEIINYYDALKNGEEIPNEKAPSYLEYIESEKEYKKTDKFNKDKAFWNGLFEEIPEVATIPSLNSSSNSCKAKRKQFIINKDLMDIIHEFCKTHKVSEFNFFMGVLSIYLGRVSNLDDFVIGTPILNRSNFKEKHTAGMFISVVPFKVSLEDMNFVDFISKISKDFFNIFRHQKYSYQTLLEDLRKKHGNAVPNLYNVMFSYQNMRSNKQTAKTAYDSKWLFCNNISDDLEVHMYDINDTGNIIMAYDFKCDKYKIEDIYSIHERILNIINQVLENGEINLKDIEIVTENEKRKLLYEFNNTKMDYPKNKTISQLFEEQVLKNPDNIAVIFGDKSLTYKELNEKANRLANYLLNNGANPKENIGIITSRSIESIIGIFAILNIGATYVPIDPNYPDDRIEYMINSSNISHILINPQEVYSLNLNKNINLIEINEEKYIHYSKNVSQEETIDSNNNLYIIFTSGSTGMPKGVTISHKNMINLISYEKKCTSLLNNAKKILQFATMSFDVSYQEIYSALLNGLTLVLIKDNDRKNIKTLSKCIDKNKIDTLFIPPAYLKLLADDEISQKIIVKNVKNIITAGEKLVITTGIRKLITNGVIIHNHYGPAETHVATAYTINSDLIATEPSIGKPISNTNIYILDNLFNLLPNNTIGQIAISGDCVGNGYINNPEFNEEKFKEDPFNKNNKMYLTGDLGYINNDGLIYFLGRNDFQVKINGFRIELEEIETALHSYKDITNCIVVVKNNNNRNFIVAYYISNKDVSDIDIRNYMRNKIPQYMMPHYFIKLDELPYNLNGKIDRKKLPMPNFDSSVSKIALSRNKIDESLIKMIEEVLNINNISIEDSFFEIGGDSLSAINLCTKIESKFNVQIFVKDVMDNSVIKDLSDYISSKNTDLSKQQISKVRKATSYPVSSAQKRIYYASSIAGEDSVLYNICGGLILDSIPDIKKLENAFNTLIDRQSSLRTYFEIENNNLVQKIKEKINFKLDIDTNLISENDLKTAFKDFTKPFDLSAAPLIRGKLQYMQNKKAILMVDMHHIISDGASLSIVLNELCKAYNGEKLVEIKTEYKDYSVWENSKLKNNEFVDSKNYWVNIFKDDIPVLDMPTNYPRPAVQSFSGNKVYAKINEEKVKKINEIANNLKITPYMLLLSAYYVLLYKYTAQEEIVVGSPIANRTNNELYNIIGMFVNSLPIKMNINPELKIADFVNAVKNVCLENYKHQEYPFDELVSNLNIPRDTSRNPLFDTMFIYQNNGYLAPSFNGINAKYYIPDAKISKYDLSLEVVPQNNILNLNFEYATSLFNKDYIKSLSAHYINILDIIIENIDIKISEINMLSIVEQNKILYELNDTKLEYPKNKTIYNMFEEQVQKTPDNIAVIFEGKSLTYKELNEKANSLAIYLREVYKIDRNDIVGIMVNRSLEMIISILAVLKAGGSYIPIDPEFPQDRIEYMLKNSSSKLLLTKEDLKENIEFNNILCVNLSNKEIFNNKTDNLNIENDGEDLSYIIYTSGSTGIPKGVALKHKALTNLTYYLNNNVEFFKNMNLQYTIASVTTVSFDIFIFETIISLQKGLKVVIANEEEQHVPSELLKLIQKEKIDAIQMTPSRMQIFLDNIDTDDLCNLKYVVLAGEPLPDSLLEKLLSLGIKKVYNGYGPSETTVFSTFTDVTKYQKVNIGKPLSNTETYILDKNMNPCPINVPGELYIAGDGLAREYLNNQELTNKLFIPNPFIENTKMYKTGDLCKFLPNGEIEYLQRIDNQIKIRGLRIELGEIESKILSYPNIKKTCVIKQNINNRDFISAYFIANKRINISELRSYLSKYLPKYMVPSYFTVMEDFPYTPNGKINKKALPLPKEILKNDSPDNNFVAPKTNLEKKFVKVWEEILNIKPIGINDNFFELGGDSILAMNLNIELKNITNSISYADIFKFPTISELIKKTKSKDENYDFNYMEKNYEKYNEILNNNLKVPRIFDLKYKSCGNILLTGATGFLGMHILDSFLKNEKGIAYCIVRSEPGLTAQAKLLQKLNYYFGNKYDKFLGSRIIAITGNISQSGFGLNQEEILSLANSVNTVINTAARVSHYGNYSEFYNANVKSVKTAIDFCKSFDKKLYHISTLSVSGNGLETSSIKQTITKTTYFAENNLYIGQSLENVYIRSKFEAECIILDAILEGLDAYILRVGNLMPRSRDGLFQENIKDNAFINRIIGFINIGIIPDYILNDYLEFTPVDTISNAIIKIATHPNTKNRIFHLFNHNHVYINKSIKYFKELNSKLEILPEEEFKNRLNSILKNKKKKNMLNNLINDLDSDLHLMYKTDIIIKSNVTQKYLSKLRFIWPKISDKYMKKFIELLRRNL